MKRVVLLVSALAGAAFAAKRLAPGHRRVDFGERIAAMPDSAPRKWVFNNVSAIRANTERILELLERQAPAGRAGPGPDSTGSGTDA
jgi:hypothetical protein